MHTVHSPKPKIFGEGYGAHLSYNLKLMRMFFKLALQIFINAIVPGVYYENAHWKVIELYHTMSGVRHGTHNEHRCDKCGGELLSSEDGHNRRAELKDLEIQCHRIEECDRALDEAPDTNELTEYQLPKP